MEQSIPLGLRFSMLHRAFKKRMDLMLAEQELTGVQFGVLAALTRMEKSGRQEISQRDLELVTHLGHPTLTEIVTRLEKKGYLRCEQSRKDRRVKSIRATERAFGLESLVAQVESDSLQWLCRGLSGEELQALDRITGRMLENVFETCKEGSDCACD